MSEPDETTDEGRAPLTAERIRELADAAEAEAEAAEREPEPEPEPAPEPDVNPLAIAVGDAYALYVAAVQEMLGPEAEILPCETCDGRGFTPVEIPADPQATTCPNCHGYGRVRTGSLVEGNTVRNCPRCFGNGYVEAVPLAAAPAAPAAPAQPLMDLVIPTPPTLAQAR